MLLKKITLENFRQFRHDSIDFAQGDDGRNVTIIIGENGTGKTTFAQAFFWCLYGETSFSDKIILNRLTANALQPGEAATVSVTLELTHGAVSYSLIRKQNYKREHTGRIKADNTIFNIAKKDVSGNTTWVKQTLCESEVKAILPKELSRYFFFDGERIEKMSKDISSGIKAQDFAEAVKGLLGLNGMLSAIQHFNPNRVGSVIRSYEESYDSRSNSKIAEYTRTINECKNRINTAEGRIEELDSEIASALARKEEKSREIKQYEEGEKLQAEKEKLNRKIETTQATRAATIKSITHAFNVGMSSFFSLPLIHQAVKLLGEKDFAGKDIPHMHADTIRYLLNQRVCICGTHLDEGTIPCSKVKELIDFLPPQSISTSISEFKRESVRRTQEQGLYESITESMALVSQQDEDIADYLNDLHAVEGRLSGDDVREKVRNIHQEIQQCDAIVRKDNAERDDLLRKSERARMEMERADTERRNLTLLDEKNKQVEIYKAYAERIYRDLLETYNASEAQIRSRLQQTINDIFKRIYEGGLSLTIDEKYHISVYATDYDGGVETSTAQSISVIFAFITGIIKMARDNRNADNRDAQLLSSEPYPLVMDAPLSAFDKRRIKTVCEALPETAEQVIIFIKDTDGDLAEEHLGGRIGCRHQFEKKNEFETALI